MDSRVSTVGLSCQATSGPLGFGLHGVELFAVLGFKVLEFKIQGFGNDKGL